MLWSKEIEGRLRACITCDAFDAPRMTVETLLFLRHHATASCGSVQPSEAATGASESTIRSAVSGSCTRGMQVRME